MAENRHGVVCEPVTIPRAPSAEFIQGLRDMGASERTVERAMGIKRPSLLRRLLRGGRERDEY